MNNQKDGQKQNDLVIYFSHLWAKRKTILLYAVVFFVLGISYALMSSNPYQSKSVVIPQVASGRNSGGGLSNLASLAGINLNMNSSGGDFPPNLYPHVLGNVHFKLAMLKAPLKVKSLNRIITYEEYYNEFYKPSPASYLRQYTIGLPGLIMGALRKLGKPVSPVNDAYSEVSGDRLITLTQEQERHFRRLSSQISIIPNVEQGFVTIYTTMPEAELAAQMNNYVMAELEKILVEYKVKNAKSKLDFIVERYNERKAEFEAKQVERADFMDNNQNLITRGAQIQLEKIQREYDLAFEVYSNLAQELEQAKIQVSQDTPVLSVIQPVIVPTQPYGVSKKMTVIIFTLLGLCIYPIFFYVKSLASKLHL